MEQLITENLKNKKVVIIGGSAGIGFATAKALAENGARVIIASSNKSRIEYALRELPKGSQGHAVDVTNEEQIRSLFELIGVFDHLVYTAGENIQLNEVKDALLPDAKRYFLVRYWGAFTAIKYATSYLSKDGSITLTSGIAANRPGKGWALGASICSAMEGLTRAMAVELSPIRVNIVSPGIVRTDLWARLSQADREGMYGHYANTLPVKFVAEASDIALSYIYLIGQRYSTGQVIVADGGAVLV